MNDHLFKERAKLALENKIPDICGVGCPSVCCDPIIIGYTLEKKETDNIESFKQKIEKYVEEFLLENNNLFDFKGIILSEINTEKDNFVSEEEIKKIILEKLKTNKDEARINKYIHQIKEKYRQKYLSLILVFSCPKYDKKKQYCLIYKERPKICRQYKCEQLEPEKISYNYEILIKRMKINYNERRFINKNITKNFDLAISNYLNNKYE